jgi:hypothetical protein
MATPQPTSPIETRLAAIEAALAKGESSLVTWLKTNLPHFITWAGVAFAIFKKL